MKRCLRLICGCLTLALALPGMAAAQQLGDVDGYLNDSPSVVRFQAPLDSAYPGNFWVGATGADRGLGYQGSYLTTGAVLPISTDYFDGWWFTDVRGNVSENGGFFANVGFGRRVYSSLLDKVLGVSVWYDFDNDRPDNFGHSFHQVGVSAEILGGDGLDFNINASIPVGTTDFVQGTPDSPFFQNYVMAQNGLDSALEGLDARLGLHLPWLEHWDAVGSVGGYYYRSDEVDPFGGITGRLDVQPIDGVHVGFQINHDERFQTTGLISVVLHLGGTRGYNATVRDLEPVRRDEHIKRYHQEPIYATNPLTGGLWRAVHVDNTAAAGGNGTVENPYNTLVDGQNGSGPADLIFVHRGDGTTTGMDAGILLQNDQYLFGANTVNLLPTVENGILPIFVAEGDGMKPIITNTAGAGVTLANDNVISGMTVDGALTHGISGVGIVNATIVRSMVQNNTLSGVDIDSSAGVFFFDEDIISGNGTNGIAVRDSNAFTRVEDSSLLNNGVGNGAGLRVENSLAGASVVEVTRNTIEGNGTGVSLFADMGHFMTADIRENTSIDNNRGDGILIHGDNGATIAFMIVDNDSIDLNGFTTGVGSAIHLVGDSTVAGATVISGVIDGNTMIDNAGSVSVMGVIPATATSGVLGEFSSDSNAQLLITNNTVLDNDLLANSAGNGVTMVFDVSNATLNNVIINNNTISTDSAGLALLATGTTQLNYAATGNDVSNNDLYGAFLTAGGTTLVRAVLTGNNLSDNGQGGLGANDDGVFITTFGGATMLAQLINNTIDRNGTATEARGVFANTQNTSRLVLDVLNNRIRENNDEGISLETEDASTMIAFLSNNDVTNNTGGASEDVVGLVDAASTAGGLCVALTNNLSSIGYAFDNAAGAATATLQVEDNGGNIPVVAAPTSSGGGTVITAPAPGTTCADQAAPIRALFAGFP